MKKKENKKLKENIFCIVLLIPSIIFVFIFLKLVIYGFTGYKDADRSFISAEQTIECKNALFLKKCKITYVPSDPWKHDLCFNYRYFFKEPKSNNVIVYVDKKNQNKCDLKSSEFNVDATSIVFLVMSVCGIGLVTLVDYVLIKATKEDVEDDKTGSKRK